MGVHRRRPRAGAARRRLADQHGVRAVPPDRHGLAAVGEGAAGHRVGARRRRHPEATPRASGSCSTTSRSSSRARRPTPIEEADRWYDDKKNNRRPPELLPRDEVARAINSEIKAGRGSPHGGVFLDIASRRDAGVHPQAAAVDVPPVQGAGRRRHHRRADGDRADLPLRDGRRRGRRPTPRRARSPACTPSGSAPAACTAPTGSAATRSRDLLVFGTRAGEAAAAYAAALGERPAVERSTAARSTRRRQDPRASAPFERDRRAAREPVHDPAGPAADDERPGRHHPHGRRARASRWRRSRSSRSAREHLRRRGAPAVQPRLAPRASTCATCCSSPSASPRRRSSARGVARRAHPRRLPRAERRVGHQEPGPPARTPPAPGST